METIEKVCETCGQSFQAQRSTKRYCSDACRVTAHRRMQAVPDTAMTRTERQDLAALVRRREKLMKTATEQRAAELEADFERQLGTIFKFDDDAVWKEATEAAERVVAEAREKIANRCVELGIPKEYAPSIGIGWFGRGENASAARRSELRKMAKTEIIALEKGARMKIERWSVDTQTTLVAGGLTSVAAQQFLENLPAVEDLMPTLEARDIKAISDARSSD